MDMCDVRALQAARASNLDFCATLAAQSTANVALSHRTEDGRGREL